MEKTVLDLLRGPPKALDIVVYLLERGEEEVGSVMSNLDLSPSTFYSAIDRLMLIGFLYERREKGFPPHTYVALTNKGREVAKLLRPLAEVVGSTIQGLELELQKLEGKERTEDENKRMVEILKDLQDISFTLGEWHEAESHARRSVDIASALGDSNSLSKSLRTLGKIHYKRGDYGDSESVFSDSLGISMRTNDLDGAAEAHYFLGAIYEKRGEYNKAIGEYKNATETSESADNEVLEAKSKLGLGRILGRKGKYRDSLKKMKESIATFERLGEDDELPGAYSNAEATAFYIDLDESLEWHEKSTKMANRNNDLRMLGFCLCNVAGCLNEKGEPKKALVHLKEASKISKKLDEKSMICSVDIQTGWAYRLQRKWKDSNGCFEHAVRVAEESDLPYELGDALLNWALVDIDRGNKREAKLKLKRALKVFDKLDNQAKVNDIKDILRGLSR